MWDYILFFALNGVAFLISLVIWELTPKPKPEDYTTVPGDKPSETGVDNIDRIRSAGSFIKYLRQLHTIYGPLASFYWNDTQIISVTSSKLIEELQEHNDSLINDGGKSLSEILSSTTTPETKAHSSTTFQFLIKEHEVVEHMRNFLKNFGKSTTAKEFIEEFVVLSVLGECSAKDFKTKSFFEFLYKFFDEEESRLGGFASTSHITKETLTNMLRRSISGTSRSEEKSQMELIAEITAIFRCLHCLIEEAVARDQQAFITYLTVEIENDKRQSFIGEIVRMSVPIPVMANRYFKEIDIDGHPIPALTPVLIVGDCLSYDEALWKNPEMFDPERFLHESKEQGAFLNLLLGKDADSQSHLKTLLYAAITNFTTTFSQLNLSIRNHDGVLVIEAS